MLLCGCLTSSSPCLLLITFVLISWKCLPRVHSLMSRLRVPVCYLSNTRRLYSIPITTNVEFKESLWKIDHRDPVIFIGSCFSENMSNQLKAGKFKVDSNPHGIMFNPISIATCIEDVVSNRQYSSHDMHLDLLSKDVVHSWSHHSSFSRTSSQVDSMVSNINSRVDSAHRSLSNSKVMFITLGTSFVHQLVSTGQVVSNCHKQPPSLFQKRLLSVDEITISLRKAVQACKNFNPQLKIVLTVSPVRHTRDGLIESARSKAHLLCAAHALVDESKDNPALRNSVAYFPAYEYVVDELRDYRWYDSDLVHPSPTTVQLVFEKFTDCFLSPASRATMAEVLALQTDMGHRPLQPQSVAYTDHLKRTLEKARKLQDKYPQIDFSEELHVLQDKVNSC